MNVLALLIALPLLGALLCFFSGRAARHVALGVSLVTLWLAGTLWMLYDTALGGYQFVQNSSWLSIPGFDISFHIGLDGLSLPLIVLTALLGVVAVLISQREIHSREPAHYATLLAIIGAITLVFSALDMIVLFLAWEAVLVLMFFLILRWGLENRRYAAMKLLVYTGIGSAALLAAIILLAVGTGTFSLIDALASVGSLSPAVRLTILLLVLFAALIKMPIVPLHTWLPDAHVQAPTAGSILLAGVMLKMGAYALLRIGGPLFSSTPAWVMMMLFWLGTVTIVYGAFVCLAQTHLKRLIAYSSVGHMGLVLVAISAGTVGIVPAAFVMVSHGLLSPLLFALAGLIHERTGTFDIKALAGLARTMPVTAWALAIAALGSMGLPGMSGFIGEVSSITASFAAFGLLGLLPVLGVLLTGAYTVLLITRTTLNAGHGTGGTEHGAHPLPFIILFVATLAIGILPSLLLTVLSTLG